MTCRHHSSAIVCGPRRVDRLRCRDGRHVWVEDHGLLGLVVTHDRAGNRVYESWDDDLPVLEQVDWWDRRGKKG